MARVYTQAQAKRLGLPGRESLEIVSGETGASSLSLRRVVIAPHEPGAPLRGPHRHSDCEECIHVLSGEGATWAESGAYPLKPGDTIVVPAGEAHVTRNTGPEPLVLLCFFPTPDVARGTEEITPEGQGA